MLREKIGNGNMVDFGHTSKISGLFFSSFFLAPAEYSLVDFTEKLATGGATALGFGIPLVVVDTEAAAPVLGIGGFMN